MKNALRLLFALCFPLLFGAVPGLASEPAPEPQARELSWPDCVKEALAGNPGLKARKLAVEQYKYLYRAGYNSYFPRVGISHSVVRSGGQGLEASNRWALSLSATEPIFDLSAMSAIRSSRIDYEKTVSEYRAASAALRRNLYSAFMNLLAAQEQVLVDGKILAIREQNAKLIRLKYESGHESRGNMLYAVSIYELSKVNSAKSGRSLNMARRELLRNMGVSGDAPVKAVGELAAPEADPALAAPGRSLEELPRLVSQKKTVEAQKERLLTAKYDLFPLLSANQSMSWSGPREFDFSSGWSLGLNLSLPLLSNGLTYYPNSTKAARRALMASEETLRELRNSLEADILNGYEAFLNARDTAAANVSVIEASEERYKESKIKYMAGQISFTDMANAEQSMVDARQNQIQYLRSANNSKSALEELLGVGLED